MKNKGFSLVELIVVIAIMAILVGVAVPVYTSYIEKSQIASDKQLVDEVQHAMQIAHAGQVLTESAYVILSDAAPSFGDGTISTEELETILKATFGDDLSGLVLKYDGWKGASPDSYANTNYNGNEGSLLNEVNRLTGALGNAVKEYNIELGDNFSGFLGGYGLSKDSSETAIGNAAVLYVAEKTTGKEEFVKTTIASNIMAGGMMDVGKTYNELRVQLGDAAALAVIYACAEGYAQYCDAQPGSTTNAVETFHQAANFDGTKNATDAFNAVNAAFGALVVEGGDTYRQAYLNADNPNGIMGDVNGYVGIMNTVNNNTDLVKDNLGSDDCFTNGNVETMLTGYAALGQLGVSTNDGEIAIAFIVAEDGTDIVVLPFELDK